MFKNHLIIIFCKVSKVLKIQSFDKGLALELQNLLRLFSGTIETNSEFKVLWPKTEAHKIDANRFIPVPSGLFCGKSKN